MFHGRGPRSREGKQNRSKEHFREGEDAGQGEALASWSMWTFFFFFFFSNLVIVDEVPKNEGRRGVRVAPAATSPWGMGSSPC